MLSSPRWQMIAQHFESVALFFESGLSQRVGTAEKVRHLQSAGRKVRTPDGSMPRRTRGRVSRKRGATESVTENTQPNERREWLAAKVKRRGKSSPLGQQWTRQEKPHAVQDKQGKDSRSATPKKFGVNNPRVSSHHAASCSGGL